MTDTVQILRVHVENWSNILSMHQNCSDVVLENHYVHLRTNSWAEEETYKLLRKSEYIVNFSYRVHSKTRYGNDIVSEGEASK